MYIRAEVHKDANRRLNFFSARDKIVPRWLGLVDPLTGVVVVVSSLLLRDNFAKWVNSKDDAARTILAAF